MGKVKETCGTLKTYLSNLFYAFALHMATQATQAPHFKNSSTPPKAHFMPKDE